MTKINQKTVKKSKQATKPKTTKKAAKNQKPVKKKVPVDNLTNYTYDEDTDKFYDLDGNLVTKKGTINLLKNVNKFKKGQSGNPAGREKGSKNRATILKELLSLDFKDQQGKHIAHPLDPSQKKITLEAAIAAALIKQGLRGNVKAYKEIQDSIYGKIKNVNEHSGPDGTALPVMIVDNIPKK